LFLSSWSWRTGCNFDGLHF